MSFSAILPAFCRKCIRSVIICSVTLLLFFAFRDISYANTIYSYGDRAVPHLSLFTNENSFDKINTAAMVTLNREPLVVNAAFTSSTSGEGKTPASDEDAAHNSAGSAGSTADWNGVIRDVGMVLGTQVAAVGVTYTLPESFSSWTPEQKKNGLKKYKRNFMNPVLDKDKFYVNYILHPYWGATYYIRGRERGLDQTSSFILSTVLSAMYEFGTECIAEKPSIQDLIITPGLGTLLGAYVFEPFRDIIKSKQELRWYDHTALVLTDPLGVLSLGIEKLFGIQSTIMVNYNPQIQNRDGISGASRGNRIGLVMQFPLE